MPEITRRHLLTGAAALAVAGAAQGRAAPVSDSVVAAAPAEAQLLPAPYGPTRVWAYDGAVPGAGLRVTQGTRIRRRFENGLPEPSTIHWHGIRIDNAMDGVPGLTQAPVAPGGVFDYDFTVPDAGTYWYHPHRNALEQVARGLAAPLIVDEAEGAPEIDAEFVLMVNDWRLDAEGQLAGGFGNMHDLSHAGRLGNFLTVNGAGTLDVPVQRHARLRLRLINAATGRVLVVGALGLAGHVVALDGMPLAAPEPFGDLVLAPAQRADLIVDVTAAEGETAYLTSVERDGTFALVAFPVAGVAAQARRPAPAPLPPNGWQTPDLAAARVVRLSMEGGAMGGMAAARVAGRGTLTIRELVQTGLVWSLNGVAGMPEEPLAEVARGETLRLPLVNDTAFAHAMHLHGHHFAAVTGANLGPLRDTVLVAPGETVEIALVADNPGDWMFHCHMLAHQAAGMMTWLRVL